MRRGATILAAMAMLSACGFADEPADEAIATAENLPAQQPQATAAQATGNAPGPMRRTLPPPVLPTEGGPVGAAHLQGLGNVIEVDLGPTLGGCSFDHDGKTLLIAGARDDRVARGRGVLQVAGIQHSLVGERTGGPDYINSGPTMTDGEYTAEVRRAEGGGVPVGIESSQWPADLVVRRGLADQHVYSPGTWTCGV